MESLSKGKSKDMDYQAFNNQLKIKFEKNKCQSTFSSTEKTPIDLTNTAREHYKNAYFM